MSLQSIDYRKISIHRFANIIYSLMVDGMDDDEMDKFDRKFVRSKRKSKMMIDAETLALMNDMNRMQLG